MIAMINRDKKPIVPKGDTLICDGDIIVLSGEEYIDNTGSQLKEFTITADHPWANKKVKDIEFSGNELVVLVRRQDDEIIVPDGDTVIKPTDKVTTNHL